MGTVGRHTAQRPPTRTRRAAERQAGPRCQSLPADILAHLTARGTALVQQSRRSSIGRRPAPSSKPPSDRRCRRPCPGCWGPWSTWLPLTATRPAPPSTGAVQRGTGSSGCRSSATAPAAPRAVGSPAPVPGITAPAARTASVPPMLRSPSPRAPAAARPPAPGSSASLWRRRPARPRPCSPTGPGWRCTLRPGARPRRRWGRRWRTRLTPPAPRCRRPGRRSRRWTPPPAPWWSRRMGRWCATGTAGMRARLGWWLGRRTVS